MKDRHLISDDAQPNPEENKAADSAEDESLTIGDVDEPVGFWAANPPMDEYLDYDPETNAYYGRGEPSNFDPQAWLREFHELLDKLREEGWRGGVISADELRAMGAFDCPPEWRKSLSAGCKPTERQRDLFPLFGDDNALAENEQPTPNDSDDDVSADDVP